MRLVAQCPDGAPPPCAGARAVQPGLLVTPFENRSRDSADTYLAATLTEDVTAALAASHAVRLLTAQSPHRGAEYRLAGSVRRENGVERVSARLERAASSEIMWATTLDGGRGALPLADQLARQVLERLGVRRAEAPDRGTARPVDPVAYDLYRRGRYFAHRRTQADVNTGLDLLMRAVARDSAFALAWAEIATTLSYAHLWRMRIPSIPGDSIVQRELEAGTRALLADSTRSEVWAARAATLADMDPTSRTAAIRAFRRALTLDSLNAIAWTNLGYVYMEAGDTAAARRALYRALAVDPANAQALVYTSLLFYWNRQYDSASVFADSAVATDPAYVSGRRLAGTVALARGQYAAAEAQFEAARSIGPGAERVWSLGGLAVASAARSDSARARARIAEMESMADSTAPNVHVAVYIAWGYAAIGDHARALDWLERYRPAGDLHFLRHLLDGPFDPLRSEPRFRRLVGP